MASLEEKFTQIYDMHADAIYRFCFYKTSDGPQAQDLTQEVFLKYWGYISKGNEVSNPSGLLFQIARNIIVDFYRKRKSISLDQLQEEGFELATAGDKEMINYSEINIALQFIQKLEETYRDIVFMRLVEEMSFEEISKALNTNVNNSTVRFHRGMKKLKNLMQGKK